VALAAGVVDAALRAWRLVPGMAEDVVSSSAGGFCFVGAGGLQVSSFPAPSSKFHVFLEFTVEPKATGYLISKGGRKKDRYWALNLHKNGKVQFVHKLVGIAKQQSVIVTKRSLTKGKTSQRFSFSLTVDGSKVSTAYTDARGKVKSFSKILEGSVDDCPTPGDDCRLHVGQHAEFRGKAGTLDSGCITEASLVLDAP